MIKRPIQVRARIVRAPSPQASLRCMLAAPACRPPVCLRLTQLGSSNSSYEHYKDPPRIMSMNAPCITLPTTALDWRDW
jgi:hypothetical protein